MEEDIFLKNMKGVKPFNKNKKSTIYKKKENKITNTGNYKNKTTAIKIPPKTNPKTPLPNAMDSSLHSMGQQVTP